MKEEGNDLNLKHPHLKYITISFIFWILIEYITAWSNRLDEWISYIPWIFFYYFGIIVIFDLIFFKTTFSFKKVFAILIFLMYPIEILLFSNTLILNIGWFLPHSIQLVSIWGFLVFVPLWIIQKRVRDNWKLVLFFLIWIPLGFVMAVFMS
ncbi:MAG: hypothetical protein GF364_21595 [Candidatus Lokiarchaeota archaeon]|nr:hypothetical protein [Candidatus Lokiarchaeota archaeon]